MTCELILLSGAAHRGREITGRRLRWLLALLADDLRTGHSTGHSAAHLVAGLWPEGQPPPRHPTKALQILVSRARARFGHELIVSTPTGYRLGLTAEQVDASAVLLHARAAERDARAADHGAALAHAEAGLALWRGRTPADGPEDAAPDDPLAALRAARAPTHRALRRARGLALSRLGRHAEAYEALATLTRERPRGEGDDDGGRGSGAGGGSGDGRRVHDEEVLLALLRSEASAISVAAALTRYESYRAALRDALGTDPGPELRALHQELLRGEAPAPPPVRHGVPHEPNPLLGRDDDLAAVAALLRASRVASVVGPGGLGKTRLAQAVARRAPHHVVHLVPLAGVTDDEHVAGEVAAALGVRESPRGPDLLPDLLSGIVDALTPGPALLVLDNCEHVLAGAAELVRALVAATRASELGVLVTSRAPLGLSSEAVHPLPELDVATCAELFRQRARAARPGVDLPDRAVTELCRHLDGLPLAVELAAARVRVMSVAGIAEGLRDRFALLRGGARDAPARHRTLQAVVDWSWNLLDPRGRAALRAWSVLPGGFTTDTAHALLGGGGGEEPDAVELLEQLVDHSLVKVTETPLGVRFWMLETVREFGAARRVEHGEDEAVTDRLLAWARRFGHAHHERLFQAEPYPHAQRVRAEQDNLLRALRLALDRGDGSVVAAVTAVLGSLWTIDSNATRMWFLLEDTRWPLSHHRPDPRTDPDAVEAARTAAAVSASLTLMGVGPSDPGTLRWLATLRRLPPAPPDTAGRALASVLSEARELFGRDPAPLLARCDSEPPLVAGVARGVASYRAAVEGDLDGALRAARRMPEAFGEAAFPWLHAMSHARIGELCLQTNRSEEARRHLAAALRVQERHGEYGDVVGIRWGMVLASLQLGEVEAAEEWLARATRGAAGGDVAGGDVAGGQESDLAARAEIALARGEVETGLHLWRQATAPPSGDGAVLAEPFLLPWALALKAVAVTAHARHGRLDLVEEMAAELPGRLAQLLDNPSFGQSPSLPDLQLAGAVLLALAMAELARHGEEEASRARAARLIALADRCCFLRDFQPTMTADRARRAAEEADAAAYAEAVAAYAALDRDGLRAAARSLLGPVAAPGPVDCGGTVVS
ncbi:ATP-binding protein [Streptomyces sp. 4N509B]|uniref:ATP-binding protein n=1 Tax=Streptomyces sp. 4N509B TaxID=3457413 RepID=UPI003FD4AD3D